MIKLPPNSTIIISRTDNIGDVVLTLPLATIIRELYPYSTILFLAKSYMKPLIDGCEQINGFLNWDEIEKAAKFPGDLSGAEVIMHVFPRPEIARMAYKAGVKFRIGTSHRWYHWLYCNRLVNFSRKNSPLHEAQLNFKLVQPLYSNAIPSLDFLSYTYGLTKIPPLDSEWEKLLDKEKFNLIIHPLSRGSSRNWDWKNYNRLIEILPPEQYKIFITGTEEELKQIRENIAFNKFTHIIDLTGKLSFSQLIAFISKVDGLVACSTGPLHLAAALGKIAVGLYPSIKPMHPGRWAPLGTKATYLSLNKDCSNCSKGSYCNCINSITAEQVKEQLEIKNQGLKSKGNN